MNIRIISVSHIILAGFLLICAQYDLFSQEADSVIVKQPGFFVGFSMGPSQTHIINNGILSVSDLYSGRQNSFGASVEIGYFFSNYIGLSSGIGFESYKTQLALAAYQNNFNAIDSENEAYERRVSGTNITEVQNIGFLSVPVSLNTRLPLNNTVGLFLQTGINLAVPVFKNYKSSGTFTYKGYYPAYNVLLEDLPAYGFPNNISNTSGGDLELKPVNFTAVAAAGLDFFIRKKIQVAVAATFYQSLSNISAYGATDKFQLSPDVSQMNSLMGGSDKVTVQSLGVNIMFRYYLKSPF